MKIVYFQSNYCINWHFLKCLFEGEAFILSKLLSDNDKRTEHSSYLAEGYTDFWSYYADALQRLDFMIQYRMSRSRSMPSDNPLEQLRGLLVTEEEVLQLLNSKEHKEPSYAWKEYLHQLNALELHIASRLNNSGKDAFIPLREASDKFKLTPLEEQCVFICLAVELDRKYEKIFGFLQDDVTCKHPTVDLLLQLVCTTAEEKLQLRQSFSSQSKLTQYFFKKEDLDSKGSLLTKVLRIDESIVNYLLNQPPSSEPNAVFQTFLPADPLESLILGQAEQNNLRSFAVNSPLHKQSVFNIWGNTGSGKKLQLRHFCQFLQKKLILIDLRKLRDNTSGFAIAVDQIYREAILQDAVIGFQYFETLLSDDDISRKLLLKIMQEINYFNGFTFLLSDKLWKPTALSREQIFIDIALPIPEDQERKQLWEHYGKTYSFDHDIEWGAIASKFKFSPGQIKHALKTAGHYAAWGQLINPLISTEVLHRACYAQVQHKLENKATRIKPRRSWDEIILPPEQKELLRNACNQVKFRNVVYGEWGFEQKLSYGKGVSILFAGPPGTGKTMAAEVLAKELFLEIYKIDLSQVISKYIGETEKNLHEIFHEAQYSNAILFFDEADALFGKRSEVKDAHDKYANIETAYLLQKIEEYAGITILATNFSQNIDDAFMRRLNYVIKFPFPDAEYREKIWKSMFPVQAPQSNDIDYKFIAQKFEIAGGNIKNIVVAAAFLAAVSDQPIGMKHIINAAKHELKKSGKLLLKEDLGEYDSI